MIDKEHFEKISIGKLNNWGEREPIVSEQDFMAQAIASQILVNRDYSDYQKSILYLNEFLECKGLEFIAISNVKLKNSTILSNNVILTPCFLDSMEGRDVREREVILTSKMQQRNRFIYDGWLPMDDLELGTIENRICELKQSLTTFALVSGGTFHWFPKYDFSNKNNSIHYYENKELEVLEELAKSTDKLGIDDRNALFRSIGWLDQGFKTDDNKVRFLFCVLAIESLCHYIEKESEKESIFTELRTVKLSKAERRDLRNECIDKTLKEYLADNPTKAIEESYFNCVVGIKKQLKAHLDNVLGTDDEGVKLFFENKEDGSPSLIQIRNLIAHGSLDNLKENEIGLINQNLYSMERLAQRYLWTVINRCLKVFNSQKMFASMGIEMRNNILSRREMYRGPVDIASLYINEI